MTTTMMMTRREVGEDYGALSSHLRMNDETENSIQAKYIITN